MAATARIPFFERLDASVRRNESLLCIGLDPEFDRLPRSLQGMAPAAAALAFNRAIIDATADVAACYKPNIAFYEALGPAGLEALQRTLAHLPSHMPTICDAKRGDFANTMRLYAQAIFDVYDFDAVTASPYLGRDAVEPFLSRRDRGIFFLCRTSNPGAVEFADLPVDGRPLYLVVADRVRAWNEHGNAGLVVGATWPDDLARVRAQCPDLPILLPGVGPQQGDLEQSVRAGVNATGTGLLVVAARQVLYASNDDDFPAAARRAALGLRERINRVRQAR